MSTARWRPPRAAALVAVGFAGLVLLAPVLARGHRQSIAPLAAATVLAAVSSLVVARSLPWRSALLGAPLVAAAVGLVLLPRSLAGFAAGATALVVVAWWPPSAAWHRAPVASLLIGGVGWTMGVSVLLVTDLVGLPVGLVAAAVVAAGAASALAARSGGAPGAADRLLSSWLDRIGAAAEGDPGERALVAPALGTAVAAGALVVLGRQSAAARLGIVVGLALVAAALVPRVRRGLVRSLAVAVDAIGQVLAVVVLAPVYVVVVVPLSLFLRLLGRRPLDVRWRSAAPSYWLDRPSGRTTSLDQMYGDQRAWQPAASAPSRGGSAWRVVVAVLVVQALLIGSYAIWERRTTPTREFAGASDAGTASSAALAGQPWVDEALRETGDASTGLVYTPFTGWSLRDHAGRYVNVRNRERRSYRPKVPAGTDPLEVWFFGGSTMFGFDLQRDEHTIPSDVARLAERDGIALRVRNFGAPGYVNYQEAVLLSLLLTSGERPDLVVFYDGVNDVSLQLLDRLGGFGTPGEPGDHYSPMLRDGFAQTGPAPDMTAELPASLRPSPGPEPLTVEATAASVLDVYGQGVDLATALCTRHDVPCVRFWQPDAFSKSPLDPGESARLRDLGFTEASLRGLRRLSTAVRSGLDPKVIDLSSSLDRVDGPVLTDTVHVNELGGRAVAEAMYEAIGDQLATLSAR